MSLFSLLNSIADGTIGDNLVNGLEQSLDQLEQLAGKGEEKLAGASDVIDTTLQKVSDGADKATEVTDIVKRKIGS